MAMNSTNNDKNKRRFEAMLKLAAIEALEKEMDVLPCLEELNKTYPPSEALNKKIQDIIKRESKANKKKRDARIFGRLGKIAVVAGIFLAVSTAVVMSIEASRNFIINVFVNRQDDHVVFGFGNDVAIGKTETHNEFQEYLPEGFLYVSSHITDLTIMTIYTNEIGQQIIIDRTEGEGLRRGVDDDYREFSQIYINSQQVFLNEATEEGLHHTAMWHSSNTVYGITSNIDIEQFFQILERLTAR